MYAQEEEKPEIICSNGRKGSDFAGNAICICDESFFGPFCTEQKPCVNGKYEKFKCVCYDNYQGEECRLPICENGHLMLGTDICVCDKGYMGTHCELCHFNYERIGDRCRVKIDAEIPNYPAFGTAKSDPNGQGNGALVAMSSPAAIGGIIAGVIGFCAIAFGVCAYRKRKFERENVGGLEHQESFPGTWSKNRISSFLDSIYFAKTSPENTEAGTNNNGANSAKTETVGAPENSTMLVACQVEVIREDSREAELDEISLAEPGDTIVKLRDRS